MWICAFMLLGVHHGGTVCTPCMHAVCLICMPALYVCLICGLMLVCTPCMHAVCLICMPALYVCLICGLMLVCTRFPSPSPFILHPKHGIR